MKGGVRVWDSVTWIHKLSLNIFSLFHSIAAVLLYNSTVLSFVSGVLFCLLHVYISLNTLSINVYSFLFYKLCVCVHVCTYDLDYWGIRSLFPSSFGFLESNSGLQAYTAYAFICWAISLILCLYFFYCKFFKERNVVCI